MSVLFHSLVALTYIALGAAVAFGLPLASAAIEPVLAFFVGGAVLVGGALVHQSIVNSNRGRDIMREIEVVSLSNEAMQRDLEAARNELHEIKEQIVLIETEINKPTAAAKGRCRSAANKIKNLSADFKRTHK